VKSAFGLSWMLVLAETNLVISCHHYSSDQSWWKESAIWVMQSWLSKLALSQVVRMNQKMDVKYCSQYTPGMVRFDNMQKGQQW